MLIVFGICFAAFAENSVAPDLSKKGSISLTLTDKKTGEPIKNKNFRLYFVAESYLYGDSLMFRYTDSFSDNGMVLDDRFATYLANHLAYYAEKNSLPYTQKETNSSGKVTFGNLKTGLYLVVPVDIASSPFLVSIPEKIDGKWYYNIDATPKVEDEKKDDISIEVEKRWGEEKHPSMAVVVLLKDGKEHETVVLSINNDWHNEWKNLDSDYVWTVIEKEVPYGYNVSYDILGKKTVITNSKEEEEETTTSIDETTNPSDITNSDETTMPEDTTTNPDVPTGTTSNSENTTKPVKPSGNKGETTTKEELADTGQLNWPIPVFAVLGLVMFTVGWCMLNLKKEEYTYET